MTISISREQEIPSIERESEMTDPSWTTDNPGGGDYALVTEPLKFDPDAVYFFEYAPGEFATVGPHDEWVKDLGNLVEAARRMAKYNFTVSFADRHGNVQDIPIEENVA
jgi:hypothetical protein